LRVSDDYCTQIVSDLATIGRARWDSLVAQDPDATVFLRFDFLHALHASACAAPDTGWTPQYLTLWQGDTLAAAVPLYVKGHSYGEYVFDWSWAEASERAGHRYYPKWLAAVPFTPVGGSRLLARDDTSRAALADALLVLAERSGLSSLHLLFAPQAQLDLLTARGLLRRHGVQFHWRNAGYRTFDDFLAALAQPKRKKIRAERRKVAEAGIVMQRKVGDAISDDDWRFFHRCYRATYAAHGAPPYLNLDFFERIGATLAPHLLLVLALRDGQPVAASLGLFDANALYGRYWGAVEAVSCLHFEACYYQMIEFAIERGISRFEGGAQGAHKLARGLDPVPTGSVHWIANPALRAAVARFLEREREHVIETLDELDEHRAFRAPVAHG
jgi:predicted N-acyltransferase